MQLGHIRPLALGIVWRAGNLLLCEYYDDAKEELFYRPLGGAIEFGEYSRDALRREFREELGTELARVHYLATLENIFTYKGQAGHEIILLYEVDLADPSLYKQETLEVREDGTLLKARWISLRAFQEGRPPLYPNGLLRLLTNANAT